MIRILHFLHPIVVATLALAATVTVARADLILIDEATDTGLDAGDYKVSGNDVPSSPGQLELEVLTLQDTPSETETNNTILMSDMQTLLSNSGITSASKLVFGFGLNESGSDPGGVDALIIEQLDMTFDFPSSPDATFSLSPDMVQVAQYGAGGTNAAEALFVVDFGGLDFMAQTFTTETFSISSTINFTESGAERFFLSGAFTAAAIPEPSSFSLSGLLGIAGLAHLGLRRRRPCRR